MLLLAIIHSESMQGWLSHPLLVLIGEISYSIYLTHMITLTCIVPLLLIVLNNVGIHNFTICWSMGLLCALFSTVALSWLCYKYIEIPCVKLGKTLNQRLDSLLAKIENEQQQPHQTMMLPVVAGGYK